MIFFLCDGHCDGLYFRLCLHFSAVEDAAK